MSVFETMAAAIFAGPVQSVHGESVSYTPKGGVATVIAAVVYRDPMDWIGAPGESAVDYQLEIDVSRSVVPTLTKGADTVALKKRITDTSNTTFTVTRVLSQDGGMWRLGLN